MSEIISYKSFDFELKDIDKGSRIMVGSYAAYNNEDAVGDIGRKGMFTKTWAENFSRVRHLLNHDVTQAVGKVERFWDEGDNAYYKSKIGTHKLGDDVLEMADSGLLNEHSYGYKTIKSIKNKTGQRELLEVKLLEFSNLTGWGVNERTPLISSTKSVSDDSYNVKMIKHLDSLEKFCRNTTASDETIELMLLEAKQLTQIIIDLTTTQPEVKAIVPDENIKTILRFTNSLN